jgi:RNA polymerase sigma-70 factor (ECF subfamily)
MHAVASSAAWEAESEYDPSRGVPFCGFARQKVLSSALTRYRQEWSYALRSAVECDLEQRDGACSDEDPDGMVHSLRIALDRLSDSEGLLVKELFWEQRSEAEIARRAGITQQAISKRKRVVLSSLRRLL